MDKRGEGTTCRNEFAPRVFAAGRMGPIRAALLLSLGALVLAAQLGAATKAVLVGPDGTLTFRDMESGTGTTTLPAVLQCEDTVARRLATLGTDIVGCHIRTARRVLRRQGIRQAACERHARARYARAVRKLNPGRCPGCLLGNLAPFRDRMTSLLDRKSTRLNSSH